MWKHANRLFLSVAVGLTWLAAAGFQSNAAGGKGSSDTSSANSNGSGSAGAGTSKKITVAGKDEIAAVTKANSAFAIELYAQLARQQKKGNLAVSPYSISDALGMAYAGAGGDTAAQMKKVLHFDLEPARISAVFSALEPVLSGTIPGPSSTVRYYVGLVIGSAKGDGVKIEEVIPQSPAEAAGLKSGQVILSMDGRAIKNAVDYANALDRAGSILQLEVVDGDRGTRVVDLEPSVPSRPTNAGPQKSVTRLAIANAVWVQKGLDLRKEYVELCKAQYDAAAQELDFAGKPDDARKTINDWIARKTEDAIKDLVGPDAVTPHTALLLTNAIFFHGDWESEFNPKQTSEAIFHGPDGDLKVNMMSQGDRFKYFEKKGDFQVVELPCVGNNVALDVFLPDRSSDLAAFEKSQWNLDNLAACWSKLKEKHGSVALPRFKAASDLELKATLAALGMSLPFGSDADFSGITGKKEVSLAGAVHRAEIEVNEKGIKAAAGTAVKVTAKFSEFDFRADRPFLFVLRDLNSNSILFIGRVTEPDGSKVRK